MKTKRERWKSRRVGVNRTIEPTMDWAKQSVWLKAKEKEEKKPLNSNPKG
jgi:hypothetical protein